MQYQPTTRCHPPAVSSTRRATSRQRGAQHGTHTPTARGRVATPPHTHTTTNCGTWLQPPRREIDYKPLSVHIFRIQLLRGTDKTYRAPRRGVLFVCPAAWTACQCLMAMQIWILAVIIRIVTMILAMISTAMTSAMTKSSASFATKTPNE